MKLSPKHISSNLCPCGSNLVYQSCCDPCLKGTAIPDTPEALMRSRYVAYTKTDIAYIEKTMMGPASARFDSKRARQWALENHWSGLQVLDTKTEGNTAYVEFIAEFQHQGHRQQLHERSEFRLQNNRWYYYDGIIISS